MTEMEWDALWQSKAPIKAPGFRRIGGTVTLFGTGVDISARELAKLDKKTEYAAQQALIVNAQIYVDRIKMDIMKMGVYDTGATHESVYILLPPNQRVQEKVRNKSQKVQRRATSQIKERSTKIAKLGILGARYAGSTIDPKTGKLRKKREGERSNVSWKDVPFTPIGTVARKNLYVGLGVGTVYAIYPHEGLGTSESKGPRRFFSENVEKWREDFPKTLRAIAEKELA